jgi:hypothetical protein
MVVMKWNRRLSALGLALALILLQASCGVTDVSTDPPIQGSDPSFGFRPYEVSDLLRCDPLPYVTTTKLVGPKGARIKVGSHSLIIPAGALDREVAITAEQVSDSVNSVRFSPEGLSFAAPAELTMTYSNCTEVQTSKRIVYTTETLDVIEVLPSRDKSQTKSVVSPLDHFSRYAIAY